MDVSVLTSQKYTARHTGTDYFVDDLFNNFQISPLDVVNSSSRFPLTATKDNPSAFASSAELVFPRRRRRPSLI